MAPPKFLTDGTILDADEHGFFTQNKRFETDEQFGEFLADFEPHYRPSLHFPTREKKVWELTRGAKLRWCQAVGTRRQLLLETDLAAAKSRLDSVVDENLEKEYAEKVRLIATEINLWVRFKAKVNAETRLHWDCKSGLWAQLVIWKKIWALGDPNGVALGVLE